MAILEADIKLLASERLNDDPDGGGFMTGNVVVDGVENNLFPDISDADRTFGRVQLRKVYVAVTSTDHDTYMGAHVIVDDYPTDPAVSALLVTKAGYAQLRSDVVGSLDSSNYKVVANASKRILGGDILTAGVTSTFYAQFQGDVETTYWNGVTYASTTYQGELVSGDVIGLFSSLASDPIPPISSMEILYLASGAVDVASYYSGGKYLSEINTTRPVQRSYNSNTDVVYNGSYAGGYSSLGANPITDWAVKLTQDTANGALLFYGQSQTTASVAIGVSTIPIVSSFAQYIPVAAGGTYPTVDPDILGVDPSNYAATGGRVKIFRPNEACVIHHTVTAAPQTVTNGQDVNLGRTRLAKVRVFGSNGVEITTGWTANLTIGHVVFSAVVGYSQPVTIQNRIEDMLLVAEALEQSLKVARAVTHAFPSGSQVSSVLMFGDLQARAHDGFAQTTWTGAWSDVLIGSAPSANYNEAAHPLVVTNAGAITERWAVIFASATSFRVVGEQVGEVVVATSGSTATDTAPLNPATGAAYFTIPSTGWGTGWAAGNVYRFNSDGANAPVWLIRSIAPSDPFSGQDKFTVAIRGNVDA